MYDASLARYAQYCAYGAGRPDTLRILYPTGRACQTEERAHPDGCSHPRLLLTAAQKRRCFRAPMGTVGLGDLSSGLCLGIKTFFECWKATTHTASPRHLPLRARLLEHLPVLTQVDL